MPFPCMQEKVRNKMDPKVNEYDPGAFRLDHLQSMKPILVKHFFTFSAIQMQHIPFPACKEKGTLHWSPKANET